MHKLKVFFGVILLEITATLSAEGEVQEYCQEEKFTAQCNEPNEVVLMESARYGRIRLGRCVRRNLGYLGCAVDALPVLDSRCSGQPGGCQLSIMDPALRDLKPCPKDVTWHLEAAYTCVPVLLGSVHECHSERHVTVTDQSAYISSSVALRTGIGTTSCPWKVRAAVGQRVNLTLMAFIPPSTAGDSNSGSIPESGGPTEVCYDVAIVRDGPQRRGITACSGGNSGYPRRRAMFLSDTNVVELEFVSRTVPNSVSTSDSGPLFSPQFIIHYQLVGCANPLPPAGASVSRDGEVLTVRCNITGETWYLTCTASRWIGTVGNCSTTATHTLWSTDELFGQSGSFPLGILIVVAVGVALGVFLGGTMLLLASMFMKRRQRRHDLGRCDGSEDFKPMEHDIDHLQDYACTLQAAAGHDLQLQHKHYVLPSPADYSSTTRKEYVVGATTDVIGAGTGYDMDYPVESRDRLPQCMSGQTPRIHYHVYESPQLT